MNFHEESIPLEDDMLVTEIFYAKLYVEPCQCIHDLLEGRALGELCAANQVALLLMYTFVFYIALHFLPCIFKTVVCIYFKKKHINYIVYCLKSLVRFFIVSDTC